MAKFCRSCGAPLEEGAVKCGSCGADLTAAVPAPAQQPKTNEKVNEVLDKVSDVLNTFFMVVEKVLRVAANKVVEIAGNIKQNQAQKASQPGAAPQKVASMDIIRLGITVVMIVLCIIAIVMNLTMKYDVSVTATATYNGESQSLTESGPMEELIMDEDEFVPVGIVCLAWAAFNLVLIIIAALLIVKLVQLRNTDGSYKAMAMTALVGDVIYMILYKLCGTGTMDSWGMEIKYSVGFTSFVWIHVVFAALAVLWAYSGKILAMVSTAAPATVPAASDDNSAE